MEGETFMVTCTRSLDMLIQSRIAVMSEDGAAKGYTATCSSKEVMCTHRTHHMCSPCIPAYSRDP